MVQKGQRNEVTFQWLQKPSKITRDKQWKTQISKYFRKKGWGKIFFFFFSTTNFQVWPCLPSWQILILFSPKLLFSTFPHPHSSSPIWHHPSTLIWVFLCSPSSWFASLLSLHQPCIKHAQAIPVYMPQLHLKYMTQKFIHISWFIFVPRNHFHMVALISCPRFSLPRSINFFYFIC